MRVGVTEFVRLYLYALLLYEIRVCVRFLCLFYSIFYVFLFVMCMCFTVGFSERVFLYNIFFSLHLFYTRIFFVSVSVCVCTFCHTLARRLNLLNSVPILPVLPRAARDGD